MCIFPEGQMTRIGQMLPFRRGMERIVKGVDVPIIPVNLGGVWGSIFSFERGKFLWKIPAEDSLSGDRDVWQADACRQAARKKSAGGAELGAEAYRFRKRYMRTLHRSFCKPRGVTRSASPWPMAGRRNSAFGGALTRTVFLARRLGPVWRDQKMVGILLPPSVPGALVNLAALLMGKVPVNLNYTASNEVLASCAKQCELKTVITSRAFLERVHIEPPGASQSCWKISPKNRDSSNAERRPHRLASSSTAGREKSVGAGAQVGLDDIATIIFSSGSTGDPKGVISLTTTWLRTSSRLNQVFMLGGPDKILGILPFFHSFGFTGTLCLPSAIGMGVVFHPSPLESRAIGALVSQYAVTFLLATPTFLQAYIRRCSPEDFGSLQYVMAGAEKLPERTSIAFEDRFGIRPLEGYGCTECSPAVTVNTSDFRAAQFRQVGAKRGSIGHPLPGISVRIVNPETFDPVP